MDYRGIRKKEKLKKQGKDTALVEKRTPVRINYEKRRGVIILFVLGAAVICLGIFIAVQTGVKPSLSSILPAAPTAEPSDNAVHTDNEEVLTDGAGNPLPTVELPNTYSLD